MEMLTDFLGISPNIISAPPAGSPNYVKPLPARTKKVFLKFLRFFAQNFAPDPFLQEFDTTAKFPDFSPKPN